RLRLEPPAAFDRRLVGRSTGEQDRRHAGREHGRGPATARQGSVRQEGHDRRRSREHRPENKPR
ncbi:hypothetical protein, partial [Tahibacter caeni]|uniref:hypothetical protein n=1 Tax=Tahibacter caeni TaxID=1453545 RepID=UPI0021490C07